MDSSKIRFCFVMFLRKSIDIGRFAGFAGLFAFGLALQAAAQEIDIGTVDVSGGSEMVPVLIESDSNEMKRLAERAFSSHGGFRVVSDRSAASFVFQFQPAGNNRVSLDIAAGKGSFQETVSGSSEGNALYRAADLAVR